MVHLDSYVMPNNKPISMEADGGHFDLRLKTYDL